jgi:hypothetical protein
VNRDFLKEVLLKKEFPLKWIEWVMQAVQGGKVSINVNGEQGLSFELTRGCDKEIHYHPYCLIWWWMP